MSDKLPIVPAEFENPLEINVPDLIDALLASEDFRYRYMAHEICWTIRTQIKMIREARGLTQQELADKAGVHCATVNRLENLHPDGWNPTTRILLKIAHGLDCALRIRFESWGEYIKWLKELQAQGIESLVPPTFDESIADMEKWAANDPA